VCVADILPARREEQVKGDSALVYVHAVSGGEEGRLAFGVVGGGERVRCFLPYREGGGKRKGNELVVKCETLSFPTYLPLGNETRRGKGRKNHLPRRRPAGKRCPFLWGRKGGRGSED